MADTLVLSKILRLRETEKQDAQKMFDQSARSFEQIATELYNILKKKERAEESYDHYIQEPTPIDKIKEQLIYIERLNEHINNLQLGVQDARNKMELKQDQLITAHVEVKKYETIIRRRKAAYDKQIAQEENKMMDEASVQQYLKNR